MAGLSISDELIRFVFFIANAVFWCIGIALLTVGIYSILSVRDYEEFDVSYVTNISGVLIALGVLMFFVGFLGCFGAWTKRPWMVYGYAITLFIFFALEFSIGVYVINNKSEALDIFEESLAKSMKEYETNHPTKKAWDSIQSKFECCGVNGPDSWSEFLGDKNVPDSCCVSVAEGCGENHEESGVAIFSSECVHQIEKELNVHLLLMSLFAIIFGMIHWFGIIVACCLGNVFKQYEKVDE